jgi:hypothetical protein
MSPDLSYAADVITWAAIWSAAGLVLRQHLVRRAAEHDRGPKR